MTVSSTQNRVSYTGNGVTTAFAFPYKFLEDADLIVYEDSVVQVITTDYTITGAGEDSGGTVTFVAAPANGLEIVIVRDPAITQGLDLVENDSLPAESVEDAFDKLTMIAQRLDDRIDRSFVLSDAAIAAADLTIPVPVADEVLKWNAAGDALESALVANMGAVTLPVPIASGGTGSTSAATARTALGLAIGTDVQAYDVDTAKLDVDQAWSAQQTAFDGTLTDGATIDWSGDTNGQIVSVTLGGNRTLAAPTNINENALYVLTVIQDGTGGRTLAWNAAYKFPGGTVPTVTATASAVDVFSFIGGSGNTLRSFGQDVK